MRFLVIFGFVLSLPMSVAAQDDTGTLADIRQDLVLLNVEMQRLRRELSTTGGSDVAVIGGTLLDRVDVIESELSRITRKTEELEHRINTIVADGTNRIGDLEFRLVELEGGDIGALGETSTLGGATSGVTAPAAPVPVAPPAGEGPELAMSEEEDFRRAQEALASGDFRGAADLFATFNATYPGGPLGPAAALGQGKALEELGDLKAAARAYLDGYSMDPDGNVASSALLQLGRTLGNLGQSEAACQTLGEIEIKFPGSVDLAAAQSEMAVLGCS